MEVRAPLTRERITRAALEFIDAEGLDALSMRKLGASLGVEAMSLYNHVHNKDDLLSAVSDQIYADILAHFEADAGANVAWQARARSMAFAYWAVAREHPQAFTLVHEKPIESMNGMVMLARCLEFFSDAGLSLADAATAFNTAAGWLLGTIAQEHGLMCRLTEGEGFTKNDVPGDLASIVDFRDACVASSPDERFAVGLDIVLAGIEARLGFSRTASPTVAPGR